MSSTPPPQTSSARRGESVPLDADVLGQVAYHVRCAAGLAAVGRSEECARHALLSWALLEAVGGDALREAVGALDLPDDVGDVHGTAAGPVRRTTEELALQLCAHFTSEGRHRLAEVYQSAYQRLASAG